MKQKFLTSLLVAAFLISQAPVVASAQAPAPKLTAAGDEPLRTNLEAFKTKIVTLRLTAGDEISGTVAEIGDNAVLLSQIVGKEYFDAVIPYDSIIGIVARTKQ